ncbi:MAG: hypothetical protein ACOYMA_01865 [Bacteroidia bacterium]
MKNLIVFLLFILLGNICNAQGSEFDESKNGLIYTDNTISKLKHIVDSLNLKHKVCDINKVYKSKFTGKVHYLNMEKGAINQAKIDMDNNITFEKFIEKYNPIEVSKELLVVKFNYENYENKKITEYQVFDFKNGNKEYQNENGRTNNQNNLKGKWIYNYYSKSEYNTESINAVYFVDDLVQYDLPNKYAKLIQYSDCLIDTNVTIFKDAYSKNYKSNKKAKKEKAVSTFINYIHKTTNRPEFIYDDDNESKYKEFHIKYSLWDSLRPFKVDSLKNADKKFCVLLNNALIEVKNEGGSNDELEEYVGNYISKKEELFLKRNRRVVGGCSMDNSPRIHALNIAKLSAETVNWEVFLRAHLDIMNDKFERVSDGSYAYGARQTYLKELEVLDIYTNDLLLGISLRFENAAENHYWGSISRIGRALSDTKEPTIIENKMLEIVADNTLDDYNRVLIYYLFLNYNNYISDEQKQIENSKKLQNAVSQLPRYLASKIELKDQN